MTTPSTSSNTSVLPEGTVAPDFTLPSGPGETISLRDLRGRPVVLVFYPADWSPVCGDEVALFNEVLPELQEYGAQVFGISVDGPWCHQAYAKDKRLRFPLLSDFEPKGEVSRRFNSYEQDAGTSSRSLFVIDKDGVIRWSFRSPIDVNPGVDGVLNALEKIAADGQTTHDRAQPHLEQSAETKR